MLSPKELAFEVCNIGDEKVKKTFLSVVLSAILAGMFIGLGYYGYLTVASGTELPYLSKFLGAIVFTVGIMMILIAGGELFTGNCLIVFGMVSKRYCWKKVFKNLGLVYLGNAIGAILLVFLILLSNPSKEISDFAVRIAQTKTGLSFTEALARGILCNILVSVGIYMSMAAKTVSGKIIAVFFPVFVFVITGFEHSVANMFVLPLGLTKGADITVVDILMNLLPVTIGNLIGGAIFIPTVYSLIFLRKCPS